VTTPVRIPADVDIADRVLGPLTARQAAVLGVTGLVLYTAWDATRTVLGVGVFLALAAPVALTAVVLALGTRDGIPLDRMLLAAVRHRVTPSTRHAHPDQTSPGPHRVPGWLDARTEHLPEHLPEQRRPRRRALLRLPAAGVDPAASGDSTAELGVVDLAGDGLAVVAVASTVDFSLRTPAEQEALVATFARYLHSLSGPVQILVRAEPLDLGERVRRLRDDAARLPRPALTDAALEHADFLTALADQTLLLRRQVLLILREPPAATGPVDGLGGPSPASMLASLLHRHRTTPPIHPTSPGTGARERQAAQTRLVRRLAEAMALLAPAGITLTGLDAARTTAVLAATCNPDPLLPTTPLRAATDDVIRVAVPSRSNQPRAHDRGDDDHYDADHWDDDHWDDDHWDDDPGDADHWQGYPEQDGPWPDEDAEENDAEENDWDRSWDHDETPARVPSRQRRSGPDSLGRDSSDRGNVRRGPVRRGDVREGRVREGHVRGGRR
jgi:hypothetical protein